MLTRRQFLRAAAAGSLAAGLDLGVHPLEIMARYDRKKYSGVTLNITTQTGPYIASAVQDSAKPFADLTGAKINLVQTPFGQLFSKVEAAFVTGSSTYDVILGPSTYMGDWVSYVVDLGPYISKDKSLKFNDIIYKQNGQWAGKQMSMPLDGDNQLMYYRRDALSNPKWKAAFKKEFGYPLAPPQTWAQALDIAKFFNGKDWAGQGKAYGILEAYKRGGQAFWYFMSNCVAYCTADGEKGGLFFDYRNMKPLINDPGHVQALKNYVEALKYGPPGMINYDSGLVRSGFAAGQGVLAIDWDDTPIVGEIGTPGSKARGHIGSQLLPGTTTVWDFKKGKWIHLSKPNRVPWLAFGGWVGYIAKASKNIDASYAYLSFLASPSFSLKMVTGAATGMNPYRFSHFSNVNAWKHAKGPGATGYPEPDLNQYLAAMRASDESPKAVHDLRIPGAAAFQDASELATSRAAAGQASPQAALNDCASTWNKLNQQKGMAKQLSAFKASLNI